MTILDQYKGAIQPLCQDHRVKHLYAFGSVLTEKFNNESDIDLIVDFDPISIENYADNYFDLKFSLQEIFKRPIDLLEEKTLRNPYLKEVINRQRQLVYEH